MPDGDGSVAAQRIPVADGIGKRFGALAVLDGVDGAGPTTLPNVPAGALRRDGGTVSFAGAEVTRSGAAGRYRVGSALAHRIPGAGYRLRELGEPTPATTERSDT